MCVMKHEHNCVFYITRTQLFYIWILLSKIFSSTQTSVSIESRSALSINCSLYCTCMHLDNEIPMTSQLNNVQKGRELNSHNNGIQIELNKLWQKHIPHMTWGQCRFLTKVNLILQKWLNVPCFDMERIYTWHAWVFFMVRRRKIEYLVWIFKRKNVVRRGCFFLRHTSGHYLFTQKITFYVMRTTSFYFFKLLNVLRSWNEWTIFVTFFFTENVTVCDKRHNFIIFLHV